VFAGRYTPSNGVSPEKKNTPARIASVDTPFNSH
jgi:hypothetical protein